MSLMIFLVTLFTLISVMSIRMLIVLSNIRKCRKSSVSNKHLKKIKTAIVAGSGGHTTEIVRLSEVLSSSIYNPRHYIIAQSDKMSEARIHTMETERESSEGKYTLHYIPRSREVRQSWLSSLWSTFYASLYSIPLIWRLKPDLLLVNGPGTCIPICLGAFLLSLFGVKKVYICYTESLCRVKTMSLSGKILYYFADHFIVQWPDLIEKYPLVTYLGRVV